MRLVHRGDCKCFYRAWRCHVLLLSWNSTMPTSTPTWTPTSSRGCRRGCRCRSAPWNASFSKHSHLRCSYELINWLIDWLIDRSVVQRSESIELCSFERRRQLRQVVLQVAHWTPVVGCSRRRRFCGADNLWLVVFRRSSVRLSVALTQTCTAKCCCRIKDNNVLYQ